MNYGKAIKDLRAETNLTQKELASRLKITIAALWKIENGKCVPKYGTIKAVCKEFHIPVAYFFSKATTIEDYIAL